MPRLRRIPARPRRAPYLFISLALMVALGGGLLLMQSGAIDALNSSGLLTEQSSAP